jgi:hypothetical protein
MRGARRSGRAIAASLLAAIVLTPAPADAVAGPVRVVAGPEDQRLPTAGDAYLIWTQNSVAHPGRDHAYGRALGTTDRFRLNPKGTQGFAGGIDPGTDTAIYQQVEGERSDLVRIHLESRVRRRVGAPLNTDAWERDPRISDAFVFFARDAGGVTSLFLFDRVSKDLDKVAGIDATRFFVTPGAVGDRYATWSVCGPFSCTAWIHDATTDANRKIPTVEGRAQYAPVVDEAGAAVYFVRAARGCGNAVGIWRRPVDLSTGAVRILALPAGVDAGYAMSLDRDEAHGRLDLWFSRYLCGARQGDLYELREVDVGP